MIQNVVASVAKSEIQHRLLCVSEDSAASGRVDYKNIINF